MNIKEKDSLFLLFFASLGLGVGISLMIKLGADPVPVLFIGLIIILAAGMIFGLFPRRIPGLAFSSSVKLRFAVYIGTVILLSVGLGLNLSVILRIEPNVGHWYIGLAMGIIAGAGMIFGICLSAFMKWLARTIISLAKGW
ncbi:hypothetical protein KKF60_01565 [Patescibacteria group bacterium]|nr:hypothetical protein [Patescibacteria group bacterium]MBU4458573.1 hypothetical protein [Patescibacteria group bacterium]MCG2696101.1 hypothetical protein [Candidatus Portnoybacteria bacterium]